MSSATELPPFSSLIALRAEHTRLLEEWHDLEDTEPPAEFLDRVQDFLRRGVATGRALDVPDARGDAQTLLNYWTTVLYAAGLRIKPALLQSFDRDAAAAATGPQCPYRGLQPFSERESSLFFGRERLVQRITNWLTEHRFVVVEGLSGSGKSSLVRAGVIPALREGAVPGSEQWQYIPPVVPGADALGALAEATRPHDVDTNAWRERLANDAGVLVEAWRTSPAPAVIVVDQFEELFTLGQSEAERAQCIAVLHMLATAGAGPTHRVVLTMRADYSSYLLKYPQMQELATGDAVVRVAPLDPIAMRYAIEQPAVRRGVVFEPGLVEDIIAKVVGEPAGLPLLQFALLKLWEQRDGRTITWAAYQALGGDVRDILTRSADRTYESFLPEDRAIVEGIFQALVRSEAGEVTSRRIRRSELNALPFAPERVQRVLTTLVGNGLLRITSATTVEEERIEVTHESLIRNWERLDGWIGEVKDRRRKRQQLKDAMEWWYSHNNDRSGLLQGVRLAEAEEYKDLDGREQTFVRKSRVAADYRRYGSVFLMLGVLSIVVVLLGLWLLASQNAAEAIRGYEEIERQTREARERYGQVTSELQKAEAERTRVLGELRTARDSAARFEQEKNQAQANLQESEKKRGEVEAQQNQLQDSVRQLFAARPAIPLKDGRPTEVPDTWQILGAQRSAIARHAASVGQLIVLESGKPLPAATAFIVAPGIVLTMMNATADGVVDFADEPSPDSPLRFSVVEQIGVDRQLFFALLRVKDQSSAGRRLPPPLRLSRVVPKAGAAAYVIGYPQNDPRNPAEILKATLGDRLGVKRVQPGYVLSVGRQEYTHDCFTAGGSGGSPLIELESGQVIGFHFGGKPATAEGPGIKQALSLAALAAHPIFVKAGITVQ